MALRELSARSSEVLPVLLKYLNDTNEKVRWPVVRGLGKMNDLSPETGLKWIEKLNDQSWYIQVAAAKSLSISSFPRLRNSCWSALQPVLKKTCFIPLSCLEFLVF